MLKNTVSSLVIGIRSNEFINIVDVIKNYPEWYFKPREIPEEVAAEFLAEICPSLDQKKILRLLNEFKGIEDIGDNISVDDFVLNYIGEHEVLKDGLISLYEC